MSDVPGLSSNFSSIRETDYVYMESCCGCSWHEPDEWSDAADGWAAAWSTANDEPAVSARSHGSDEWRSDEWRSNESDDSRLALGTDARHYGRPWWRQYAAAASAATTAAAAAHGHGKWNEPADVHDAAAVSARTDVTAGRTARPVHTAAATSAARADLRLQGAGAQPATAGAD